ncbi:hypothetical protein [Cellvibrio sp. QJXJ]|uniref:hypothetical protein n=1 Tax=Cellvibrio sp. QJXJ TaxID=2964606 RepID=UPI0021C2F69A|nr:hypothetical protein [Cellvibrio sp. QJXJ]UUA74233.1 hypothetical protein NNX04_07275 [Cellvibrio sp. QJXJ]
MISQPIKNRTIDFLFNGVIAVVVVSFFGAFVYYGFIHDDRVRDESVETSNTAIRQYIANQTMDNAKFALDKLAECYALANTWVCSSENERAFIKALATTSHIDLLFSHGLSTASDLKHGLDINQSSAMALYTGKVPEVLFLKANAMIRHGNIQEALPIYKALFLQGEQWSVATSLRSVFKHYGCIDDVEIWGEFTAADVSRDTRPPGSAYPEQPRIYSVDEIVDRRIRLRNGEFITPSPNCPINLLMKRKASDPEASAP